MNYNGIRVVGFIEALRSLSICADLAVMALLSELFHRCLLAELTDEKRKIDCEMAFEAGVGKEGPPSITSSSSRFSEWPYCCSALTCVLS